MSAIVALLQDLMLGQSIINSCRGFVVDESLGVLGSFDLLVRPGWPVPVAAEHSVYGCQLAFHIHTPSISR